MKPRAPTALLLALAAAPLPFAGSNAQAQTVVVQWNEATIAWIEAGKPPPTAASRALAIVATAMYDAWTAFDTVALPTQPNNGVGLRAPANLLDETDKEVAVSYAAYQALSNLFPATLYPPATYPTQYSGPTNTPAPQVLLQSLLTSLQGAGATIATTANVPPQTAADIGILAGNAVVAARANDNSNQTGALSGGRPYSDYTGYTAVNSPTSIVNPNLWQPLSVLGATQKYATPFWGTVTPFATLPPFQGQGPATYPSWQYTAQTALVLLLSATLNNTTKVIADYWADSPGTQLPPGHWSRIGEFVSARDQHNTDADAKMFFALNNALMDAGILCWSVKRAYTSERPITSTHFLFTGKKIYAWAGIGQGSQWIDGSAWLPYQEPSVVTPPFPEYTSGHSTFSAAAATILQNFTNSDWYGGSVTYLPGSTSIEPGIAPSQTVILYYPSFSYAAAQAGISRLYGGIHFMQGNLDGRFSGRVVGQFDWMQAQSYITGGAGNGGNPYNNNNGYGGHWPPQHYGAAWNAHPGAGWGQGWGGWGGDWGGD
jgi:hypothetical protein